MSVLPPKKLIPVAPLQAYVMDGELFKTQWAGFLAPFVPPLPREGEVILCSYFGDVFVEDTQGAVWWVNGMEERVDRIGINRDKAMERIEADNLVTLKTKLMEQLIKADMLLPVGMLYGLRTPRAEGGKYHPDNIGTAPIADAFAYMGVRFRNANAEKPKPPEAAKAAGAAKDNDKNKSPFWGKKK
ncbi:MAG TPA: hypothetical protein VGO52_11530 [Hyphomonadaceae bacterium]|jgi:hypothetical protein|nr:hypothetical protein [Hyphomonadaceae bacterium]